MKTLLIIFTIAFSTASFAGPGHGHSHSHAPTKKTVVGSERAQEIATYHVKRLAKPHGKKKSKVDASWGKAIFDKAETKIFSGHKEWVVTFNNKKGIKGKKIYIFLKETGEFVAANFTGK